MISRKSTGGPPHLHPRPRFPSNNRDGLNAGSQRVSIPPAGSSQPMEYRATQTSRKTTGGRRPPSSSGNSNSNNRNESNAASRTPLITKAGVPSSTQSTSNKSGPSRLPSSSQHRPPPSTQPASAKPPGSFQRRSFSSSRRVHQGSPSKRKGKRIIQVSLTRAHTFDLQNLPNSWALLSFRTTKTTIHLQRVLCQRQKKGVL